MKFQDMPYERIDFAKVQEEMGELIRELEAGEERGGAVRGASEVLCADGPCHDADDDREYPLRHRYFR